MAQHISARFVSVALILLILAVGDAAAQSSLIGHVFAGWSPYARDHQIAGVGPVSERGRLPMVGGGIEWRPRRALGLTADGGIADYDGQPIPRVAFGVAGDLPGARIGRARLTPFLTAGSALTGEWTPRLVIGAGARYAAHPRVGLRMEWQQQIATRAASIGALRVGLGIDLRR